jgi:hypothetical protein
LASTDARATELRNYANLIWLIGMALIDSGCGRTDDRPEKSLTVNEVSGSVGGVRISADKATVRRHFGDYGRKPQPYPSEPREIDDREGSGGPRSGVTGPTT